MSYNQFTRLLPSSVIVEANNEHEPTEVNFIWGLKDIIKKII